MLRHVIFIAHYGGAYAFEEAFSIKEAISTVLLVLGTYFTGRVLSVIAPEEASKELQKNSFIEKNEKEDSLVKLAKLKQNLDSGIITQEEFDAKKKQLLGL